MFDTSEFPYTSLQPLLRRCEDAHC